MRREQARPNQDDMDGSIIEIDDHGAARDFAAGRCPGIPLRMRINNFAG